MRCREGCGLPDGLVRRGAYSRAVSTPEGSLIVRLAGPPDATSIGDISVVAWRAAYAAVMPEEYLTSLDADERAARQSPAEWWGSRCDARCGQPSMAGVTLSVSQTVSSWAIEPSER